MSQSHRIVCLLFFLAIGTGFWPSLTHATSSQQTLKAVFGISRPPFISSTPPSGLAWELAGEVFRRMEIRIKPSFSPNKRMVLDLTQGTADIAVEVQPNDPRLFYSAPFIAYRNFVVTRKRDGISFKKWDDLKGFSVCAWQGATSNLGPTFEKPHILLAPIRNFPIRKFRSIAGFSAHSTPSLSTILY